MRVAVDGSSLMWTCLLVGEDKEGTKIDHNGKMFHVNTAMYGYEFAVNSIIATLRNSRCTPKDLIFVWEGYNSKANRLTINQDYKSKRGDRPLEAYAEFNTLKGLLQSTFSKLGALSLTQEQAEADDSLAWLAENSEDDLVISTNDNDLSVLNGVNGYGATITVVVKGAVGENKYGDWPCKYITLYKSMVGDTTDTIVGIKGFGPGAWQEFMTEFGVAGLEELDRLARLGSFDELVPEMDQSKMITRLVNGRVDFFNSWQLAKLHPEWVNTFDFPVQLVPGLIKGSTGDERLAHWESTTDLITVDVWDRFKQDAYAKIMMENEWIALDIETSTPDESDDWLAAQNKKEGVEKVDVIGSELTGMSLTFGDNLQHTVYIPVDHADTANVPKDELRDFLKTISDAGVYLVIQNTSFESTVLFNEWGVAWKDNGYHGFLPKMLDTKIEASYVNENESLGLKKLSKMYFNYDQVDYKTVTTIDDVQYKMRELTGAHVKDYGCDDTICTASLHNFFMLFMQLEHTWKVYLDVEIDAMYLHTQSFVHGVKCDVAKSKELEAIDDQTSADAWQILSRYLVERGWAGTVPPVYTEALPPAQVKEAFLLTYGKELETRDRMDVKVAAAVEAQGGKLMAELLRTKDYAGLTNLVQTHFTAKPEFNVGSTVQVSKLLYTIMGLPIRIFNKPTDIMRKQGIKQGSAKTDELAIAYAKQLDATPEQKEVLEALRLIKMVNTRRGLYYSTYPYFLSWKTGKLHPSHNQCQTNTRRASTSSPNTSQLPKHPKIEGQAARFREVIVPHKSNAVIVSMDFAAQELRVIAEYSQDKNMLACFVGDYLKDMHSLTGLGVAKRKEPAIEWTYELFMQILGDSTSPMYKVIKECRKLGKSTNFSTEFGARAPKLAQLLLITEEDAQAYIDAKAIAFPEALVWKDVVVDEVQEKGYVTTMLGARRHLHDALESADSYEASKAERQAVNFKVQSSSAEMTKLAEGRMWKERLEQRFDCQIYFPVHDEVVASCAIEDLVEFIPAMHRCMVAKYATMQVPIMSSISFGPSFGEQIEIGELPSKDKILEGIDKLPKLG